jgi:hypothetical protein
LRNEEPKQWKKRLPGWRAYWIINRILVLPGGDEAGLVAQADQSYLFLKNE